MSCLYQKKKKNNLLLILLKNEEFDIENNFLDLLPDELNDEELDMISELVNKTIGKSDQFEISFDLELFKRKDFIYFLKKIKLNKINHLKILNIIIGYVNENDNEEKYENIENNNFLI